MENTNNPKVGPGMFVAYDYKLYDDADGRLLFETPKGRPDTMIFGVSNEVVPGLIAAMDGLSAGDKFGVTLPPMAAFGDRYEDDVLELDRTLFMRDGKLAEEVKVDARIPMMTADGGRVVGTVLDIGDEKVKMDFNHPFAGLTVRYDGRVVDVRPATPEELHPAHGCCGHCGGGSCGGGDCGGDCDCDGDCGDDCNCGEK